MKRRMKVKFLYWGRWVAYAGAVVLFTVWVFIDGWPTVTAAFLCVALFFVQHTMLHNLHGRRRAIRRTHKGLPR